jgi:microcystin-dependent protein
MSAREFAKAVQAEARRAAVNEQSVRLATIEDTGPLVLTLLDSGATLHEENLILSQGVKAAMVDVAEGDMMVLVRRGAAYVVISVASDKDPPPRPIGFLVGQMIGSALVYASGPPNGWMKCEGYNLPDEEPYVALRTALLADGAPHGMIGSNPRIPDMRDKTMLGSGGSRTVGTTGGEETHVLTLPETPSHVHPPSAGAFVVIGAGGGSTLGAGGPAVTSVVGTASAGGDGAHNNMQPFMVATYLIKL